MFGYIFSDQLISIFIVVLVLIFCLYLISKIYFQPKEDLIFNNFSMLGGYKKPKHSRKEQKQLKQISEPYPLTMKTNINQPTNDDINIPHGMIVPKSFPQVGVLTNEILYKTPLEDFYWLEKTDGEHANLIIFSNTLYSVVHGRVVSLLQLPNIFSKQTILDTEHYNNKWYIFDSPMIENKDISTLTFKERMEAATEFLSTYPSLQNLFEIKQFNVVDSTILPQLIKTINSTNISPTTGNKIDGVVLQIDSLPYYYDKGNIVFKLKRRVLNTIDFKLHYNSNENIFYLYLIGSYINVLFNKQRLPHEDIRTADDSFSPISKSTKQLPNKLYILFDSSYFPDLHSFVPCESFNVNGYFADEISQITELQKKILADPMSFDKKIVELSLNEDNIWVPLRVRTDKKNSNSYDVGLSNCSVMFNPITEESINDSSLYFTKSKQLAFDSTITDPYHDINKLIRLYNIERTINHTLTKQINNSGNLLNVLDLAGGRGADELSLYHCGATNIFAMDSDRTALVQYVERTSRTTKIKDFHFLLPDSIEPKYLPKFITINAIHGWLGEDNSLIESDIISRSEYPCNGFDAILMNYAIHYLCDSTNKIDELHRLVSSLLKQKGLFIFTCFDGDEILKLIQTNEGKVSNFKIELTDRDNMIARMPLPTIDSSGYREEPLATKDKLAPFLNSKELSLLPGYPYSPIDCISNLPQYKSIVDKHKVSDFLKYIRVYAFEKK